MSPANQIADARDAVNKAYHLRGRISGCGNRCRLLLLALPAVTEDQRQQEARTETSETEPNRSTRKENRLGDGGGDGADGRVRGEGFQPSIHVDLDWFPDRTRVSSTGSVLGVRGVRTGGREARDRRPRATYLVEPDAAGGEDRVGEGGEGGSGGQRGGETAATVHPQHILHG
jgi:hypothetical protein